jgi:hypothetical protein
MSTLNPLQSLIIRHFALLQLLKSGIAPQVELDDVLELLEARKNQWWNKIFKNNAKKDTKKKGTFDLRRRCSLLISPGIFGVPLEILVERTGSDSQQGASNAQLRVPEIIEDIISTMRQMGMSRCASFAYKLTPHRHGSGGNLPKERKYQATTANFGSTRQGYDQCESI